MEIESKWLVDKKKFKSIIDNYCNCIIGTSHYYMNSNKEDSWTIRFSKYDYFYLNNFETNHTRFKITLKDKGLTARNEIICNITQDEFDKAISNAYSYIKKDRSICIIDGIMYEIDTYDYYDFITCEVEFKTLEDLKNFKMPDWCTKDVTEDPTYKNVNLAKLKI